MFLLFFKYPKKGKPVFVLSEGPFHDLIIGILLNEGKKSLKEFFRNFSYRLGPL